MAFHLNTVLYKFLSFLLLNSLKLIVCLYVSDWYLLRVKILLKPHPDWYLLGVHLKFSNEHPRPLYMGVPFPGERYCCLLNLLQSFLLFSVFPTFRPYIKTTIISQLSSAIRKCYMIVLYDVNE